MLRLDITGLEGTEAALDAVADALNPVHVVDEASALLLNRIRTRYLAETDTYGKKWIPSFAAQARAKRGRGGGTLYNTGNLFRSLQVFSDGPSSRKVGTDVEYADTHQYGLGQIKREFVGANDEDINLMVGLVLMRVRKAVK